MPSNRPPVSLIIATRGRGEMLAEALSFAGASLQSGDELIVVESGEGGAAAALAPLTSGMVRIEHIRIDRPGKSRQLNLGVRAATTEVLLFSDDDVRIPPGWPEAMAAPFVDPSVGAAFGQVHGLTRAPGFDDPTEEPPGEAPFETWQFAHGAAMSVRASAVRAVGGFDERLGPGTALHGEEHDLVLRLREGGWRVMIAGAPPVEHMDWRTDEQQRTNALVYERGSGAVIGLALRRSPRRGSRLLKRRLAYQRMLIQADRGFGVRGLFSFGAGVLRGLGLRNRDWLA